MRTIANVDNLTWDIDLSQFHKLADNLRVMATHHIEYGILNKEKYPPTHRNGGKYVAQVAAEHELGWDVTERPFFTQSYPKGKKEAKAIVDHLFKQALTRRVDEVDLAINAERLADTVREEIDSQQFFDIDDDWKKEKGRNDILKDTDLLYNSITGKAVKGQVPQGGVT